MFGTLKPHACGLGCSRKREYATFYCGLCKSLGDNFGTLSRALLNYDAVFLALVADGLMQVEAAPDRCRCPMLPVVHRPTVRPDSTAMRYAAAMQMLLSDQWLADRAVDGRRTAQATRPLLSGKVAHARAILDEIGISLAELEGFEERQARCEELGVTGPRDAAAPTAAALALVFETMSALPGVVPEAATHETKARLRALGERLGSAIYLVDALDDLEKDHAAGAFNPCLVRARGELRVSWRRVEEAARLLDEDLVALRSLTAALPFARHCEIIANILGVEMPALARRAAKRAHEHARRESTRAPARPRALPIRLAAQAATLFLFLWVWLSSMVAFAKGERRPSSPGVRDAGADASDAGDAGDAGDALPPATWDPIHRDLVDPWDSGTRADEDAGDVDDDGDALDGEQDGGEAKGGTRGGAPGYADCSQPCKDCSKSIGDACGQICKPCGDLCSGCGNCWGACDGCNNACKGCCDSCGKCGDGCKGCSDSCGKCGDGCKGCSDSCGKCGQCGDCCKGCNGCDNCCKGCNGCDNCCKGCNGCDGCGNCGSCK